MCGIAGIVAVKEQSCDWLRENIGRMTTAMASRGPDGGGVWFDSRAGIALGHRRLAIVDLTDAAAQPMISANGRWVITFNGEIYNHVQLRRALTARGFAFHSMSDTEVVAAAVECWGMENALRHLDGMFAFGLWDRRDRQLLLARDRFGEKPLYYSESLDWFAFASDLAALERLDGFDRAIDTEAREELLERGYVRAPRSIFMRCRKLAPAHWMEHGRTPQRYWRVHAGDPFRGSFHDAEAQLEILLAQSVQSRCSASVPVGMFLSGGVDSSIIAAFASKIPTFTLGFESAEYDESVAAEKIAGYLEIPNERLIVTAADAARVIPRLPHIYSEPFADSSQVAAVLVSELAGSQVKVALAGDGGDELFAGYPRYRQLQMLSRVPAALRRAASGMLRRVRAGEKSELLQQVLMQQDLQAMYGALMGHHASPPHHNSLSWMGLHDLENYLSDDLLVKVDRAAMSVGLETRLPMLAPELVSFALSLPAEFRAGKRILKAVLERHVPRRYFHRPKRGFSIPVAQWLRGPLRDWAEDLIPGITGEIPLGRRCVRVWSRLMLAAWLRRPSAPTQVSRRALESVLHPAGCA